MYKIIENIILDTTFVDILNTRALHQPEQTAYTFLVDGETEEISLTYQELDKKARAIATVLQSMKAKGERALLLYQPGLEFIAAFFGCLYAGLVAVPAYPPRRNQKISRLQAIVSDAQAVVALTTESLLPSVQAELSENQTLAGLSWLATDNINNDLALSWQKPSVNSDTLAFLQYTSGSTGTPKGVMITHGNLVHNSQLIYQFFGHTPESRGVIWLPPYHDMGLIGGVLQFLYGGFPVTLMAPVAFLQKPFRWLQAISRYKATSSGGPDFAYELACRQITPEQLASLDLSSWDVAFTGAEPIRAQTLKRFTETFAPCGFRREAFYPCYGMAETTLIVSGGLKSQAPIIRDVQAAALEKNQVVNATDKNDVRTIVSCGQSHPDQKVLVVDPASFTSCADKQVGEIWVSGQSVAQGYWNRSEQTKEAFQAYLADGKTGPFLRTGDLGFLWNDELFITGRLKDLIIIMGRNHYPQDIEFTVENSHPALRPSCGAAFAVEINNSERLVIVQEVERSYLRKLNTNEVIGAIRKAVGEEHDLQVHAILLLKTNSLPKTSSGKVRRSTCRTGFQEATLDVVADWSINPENKSQFRHLESEVKSLLQKLQDGDLQAVTSKSENLVVAQPQINQTQVTVDSSTLNSRQKLAATATDVKTVESIQAWLVAKVAEQLQVPPQEIDICEPLAQYGLGSLAAVRISGELQEWLGREVAPTLLYDYPTIQAIGQYLVDAVPISRVIASATVVSQNYKDNEAIAIIGIGCRFPGANNPEAFWQLLRDGVDAITEVPASRWNVDTFYDVTGNQPGKMNTRWGGFLEQVDKFDPQFFGISPREAELMDPQQRLLLEVSWEALEYAGIAPEKLAGSNTGVFVGISNFDYSQLQFHQTKGLDAYTGTGNAFSITANRLSYLLDLHGPSWAVDTACSSSLVAVHQACQSLRQGECELALAGGVNLILTPQVTITFSKAGMMAADGRCKTFDADANGYVRGEGCGVVILKRLADAKRDGDNILAVIKGSAVNQDGRSNGLTAPNSHAQQAVIRQALENAHVMAAEIGYVEAHGTGTFLGDSIELNSLKAVTMQGRMPEQPCVIGSVKTNIGHLEAAAGIAGLIKVVLSLQHEQIPPHLHLKQINPHISLAETPLSIATQLQPWSLSEGNRRLAGVSSFGFGGTNAHVILESASKLLPVTSEVERSQHLFALSAKSESALQELVQTYQVFLASKKDVSIADICFTTNTGRSHFAHRLALVAAQPAQILEQLTNFTAGEVSGQLFTGLAPLSNKTKIAFLFTGQGSQYVGMGRELYETQPTFRKVLQDCDRILRPYLEIPLLEILYPANPENSPINETAYTQPALFALEYALYQLWKSWGITPDVVMGHSVGEYVAATIAGVFSLEDGLKLIAERGRLIQTACPSGGMVAVFTDIATVTAAIQSYENQLSIAAINGHQSTVISGELSALEAVTATLQAKGIKTKPLKVTRGFHSPLMQPILQEFEQILREITYYTPQIKIISNVTGTVADESMATPEYWCHHLHKPVLFAASMDNFEQSGNWVFVEIGAQPTLLGMGRHYLPPGTGLWVPSLRPGHSDWQQLLTSLGELYVHGVPIDWSGFEQDYPRRSLQLPTYPFQRQRYWNEHPQSKFNEAINPNPHPLQGQRLQLAGLEDIRLQYQISPDAPGFLQQHRIFNQVIVPTTVYLEMIYSAGVMVLKTENLVLAEIGIQQPLILAENEVKSLQMILTPQGKSAFSFQIFSLTTPVEEENENSTWVLHTSGKLLVRGEDEKAPPADLTVVQTLYQQEISVPDYYQQLQRQGIDYGSSFQIIKQLWRDSESALGQIQLPEALVSKSDYQLHPVLLDACMQVVGALSGKAEGRRQKAEGNSDSCPLPVTNGNKGLRPPLNPCSVAVVQEGGSEPTRVLCPADFSESPSVQNLLPSALCLLPSSIVQDGKPNTYEHTGIEKITIFKRPENRLWSQARLRPVNGSHSHSLSADVQLFTDDGQLVAVVEGLQLQPINPSSSYSNWLYEIEWRRHQSQPKPQQHFARSWLIFADTQGIGKQLAALLSARGEFCTLIFPGNQYQQLTEHQYTIDLTNSADFQRLLQDLVNSSKPPLYKIVHLWSLDAVGEALTAADLETAASIGCGSTLHLVQSLVKMGLSTPPSLCLVTRGAQAVGKTSTHLAVEQSPLWGLGKVIHMEHPEFNCMLMDLDPSPHENQVQDLFTEIWSANSHGQSLLAWRQKQLYLAQLVHSRKQYQSQPLNLQENSTYLIVGALGGIGLHIAQWMVECGASHLVLVGRSGADAHAKEIIKNLEQLGTKIVVATADISQMEQVAKVLADIKVSMPPLRGIIHSAGIYDDRLLRDHKWELFMKVFAPKVSGSWNLHMLTKDMPLDFFVLFSSVASMIGGPGLSNYVAANTFLDALAHYRQMQGLPALSINWGPWAKVGMATTVGSGREAQWLIQGLEPMQPQQALLALRYLLSQNTAQVGVIPINWSKYLEFFPNINSDFLEAIIDAIPLRASTQADANQPGRKSNILQQLQESKPSKHLDLLVTYLQQYVSKVLGFKSSTNLEIQQSLLDLGLDSLMAVQVKNWISTDLAVNLPIERFINDSSLLKLAKFLQSQLALSTNLEGQSNSHISTLTVSSIHNNLLEG
ncbi:MAG: SDR family NAD(P)-dependent oxidoreductase, partial [Rhizonema sp. PD37]|nr:SDR family NAD(P)-dependent oxidoreductase [Rhizonema sp. PD37]